MKIEYTKLLKRVEQLEKTNSEIVDTVTKRMNDIEVMIDEMNGVRPDQREFESRLTAAENGLRSIQRWIPRIRELIGRFAKC
jgi:FtsZ-binding cell division protein ZapB